MTHPKRPRDGMFEPAGGRGESAAKGCRYSGTKGGESSSSSGKRLISFCRELPGALAVALTSDGASPRLPSLSRGYELCLFGEAGIKTPPQLTSRLGQMIQGAILRLSYEGIALTLPIYERRTKRRNQLSA